MTHRQSQMQATMNLGWLVGMSVFGLLCLSTRASALTSPCLPGDANGDCVVDEVDLAGLTEYWLSDPCCDPEQYCVDLNDDGVVNLHDFAMVMADWQAVPQASPRIAAQADVADPQFYHVQTGARFVPRGVSYMRLDPYEGKYAHVTLNTGFYDPAECDTALAQMAQDGYNVVRVVIHRGDDYHESLDQHGVGGPKETRVPTLYQPFVDNFIDFLRRARKHGLHVYPRCWMWPYNKYYNELASNGCPSYLESMNMRFLYQGAITAKKEYMEQLVQEVKNAEPNGRLLSTVFAWIIENEMHYTNDLKPFSLDQGIITTAYGGLDDLSTVEGREHMASANAAHHCNTVTAAIRAIDPDAMTAVSLFTYDAVGKDGPSGLLPLDTPDPRFPVKPTTLLLYTDLSFMDMHIYPRATDYTVEQDLASSEYAAWDRTRKPIIVGEYGASRSGFPTEQEAAQVVGNLLDELITQRNFQGAAAYFTWDSYEFADKWWYLAEGNRLIHQAIDDFFDQ